MSYNWEDDPEYQRALSTRRSWYEDQSPRWNGLRYYMFRVALVVVILSFIAAVFPVERPARPSNQSSHPVQPPNGLGGGTPSN